MKGLKKLFISTFSIYLFLSPSCSRQPDETAKEPFLLEEITITELQEKYDNEELTIREVVQMYLERIQEIDREGPALNSILHVNPEALEFADSLDRELRNSEKRGPMHGVPVILKDNLDTKDKMPTTAGSIALRNSFPQKDSKVAENLRKAGAVIIAKANLSEWANFRASFSSSGWSGLGGQTKNPYVLDRNPCGSSSGSAVAVSANLCMVAIGTETNGSITCPSNANGIVGIKPTVGLVSRSGVIPISSTQDTPGPMARNIEDAAICLGVLTGVDSADDKTLQSRGNYHSNYQQFLKEDALKGKRIGLYTRPMDEHHRVDTLMNRAKKIIESQGAEIIELDRLFEESIGGYSFTVMLYEFKEGLNRYFKSLGQDALVKSLEELIEFNKNDSVEMRWFDQELLIMANEKGDLNSPEYLEAHRKLMEFSREKGLDKIIAENNLDGIIAPTGGPAWKTDLINGDNFHVSSSSPAAWSGYPNITLPMGFIDGLPVGISFFGKAWTEPGLISMAYAFEKATRHRKAPQLKKTLQENTF